MRVKCGKEIEKIEIDKLEDKFDGCYGGEALKSVGLPP